MIRRFVLALTLGASTLLPPGLAAADDSWLDTPLVTWNQPGMGVPIAAPAVGDFGLNDPFCSRSIRPPETAADLEVTAAGWSLVGSYEGGWGVLAVTGTTGFDGMCRPMGYQVFVFAARRLNALIGGRAPAPSQFAQFLPGSGNLVMDARIPIEIRMQHRSEVEAGLLLLLPRREADPIEALHHRIVRAELVPVVDGKLA